MPFAHVLNLEHVGVEGADGQVHERLLPGHGLRHVPLLSIEALSGKSHRVPTVVLVVVRQGPNTR